jgi:V-type H+-transporting ATPase subunit E
MAEVSRQLEQMVRFIRTEADEKVNELRVRGEQEANIEQQRIYSSAKIKIDQEFARREKQLDVRKRMYA